MKKRIRQARLNLARRLLSGMDFVVRRKEDDPLKWYNWYIELINESIVCWVYKKEHEDDPRMCLQEVIQWNTQVALDPAVSKEARDLIERGRSEALAALLTPEALRLMISAFEDETGERLPDGDGEDYKIASKLVEALIAAQGVKEANVGSDDTDLG